MSTAVVIRYLDHHGDYLYLSGTDNAGGVLWATDTGGALLMDEARAQRLIQLCLAQGFDAEVGSIRLPGSVY